VNASPSSDAPEIASPADGAPALAKPRRRWVRRVLLTLLAAPFLLYGALEIHARLTRLPDLGDDLAVLLPAQGVALYAEIPAPAELIDAVDETPLWRALSGLDGIRPLPGDDDRETRREAERTARFRQTMGLVGLLKKPLTVALVHPAGADRPSLIILTRSEPSALQTILSIALSFSWSYDIAREKRHGADIATHRDLEDPADSFQYAQLGDVLAINYGSADPAIMRRLADAWRRPNRQDSFAPLAERTRERLESLRPATPDPAKLGGREWFFAVANGPATVNHALAEAERVARQEPSDAKLWLDLAALFEGTDQFALEVRSLPAVPSAEVPARLEATRLSRSELPVHAGDAPPFSSEEKAFFEAPAWTESFRFEAGDVLSAAALLDWLLPRLDAEPRDPETVQRRAQAARQPLPAGIADARLALRLTGAINAERLTLLGSLQDAPPSQEGDSLGALTTALARRSADGRWHLQPIPEGKAWLIRWPDPAAPETPALPPAEPFAPGARWVFDGGALSKEAFDRLGLDWSSSLTKPKHRRAFIKWLEALRGARLDYASRPLEEGDFSLGVLRWTASSAASNSAGSSRP
jgi:hypothetical protein